MISGLLSPTDLFIGFWGNAKLQPVDTTILEAIYDLNYRRETISGVYFKMRTVLQISNATQKYYSIIRQLTDDIQIDVFQQIKGVAAAPGIGIQHKFTDEEKRIQSIAGVDWLNSEIWVDIPGHKLTERTHDYDKFDFSIEYEEPIPVFDWKFTKQTDTICGYPCYTATSKFRGREWTVWYTPEIPVGSGPWKFNGLPGLILRAQDARQDYIWECQSILQKAAPIVYYKVESMILSREKWRRYLRQIHEAPLAILGHNGMHEFYIKGKLITEEDNWQVPYNPLELE